MFAQPMEKIENHTCLHTSCKRHQDLAKVKGFSNSFFIIIYFLQTLVVRINLVKSFRIPMQCNFRLKRTRMLLRKYCWNENFTAVCTMVIVPCMHTAWLNTFLLRLLLWAIRYSKTHFKLNARPRTMQHTICQSNRYHYQELLLVFYVNNTHL